MDDWIREMAKKKNLAFRPENPDPFAPAFRPETK
jgi:hypothetical protein